MVNAKKITQSNENDCGYILSGKFTAEYGVIAVISEIDFAQQK